jgi:hypothetical protein
VSNLVFPSWILGALFTQRKTPQFNTGVNTAMTGKASRLSRQAYPLYGWELGFELLRDDSPRVNYVLNSQDLTVNSTTSASGTGLSAIIIGNYTTAPDGTLTADRVILNIAAGTTSSDKCSVGPVCASMSAGGLRTISFYARTNIGGNSSLFVVGNGLSTHIAITAVWTRYAVQWISTAPSTGFTFTIQGDNGSSKYVDMSIWGMQVDDGIYSTTYIPTFGSAARVGDLKDMFSLFMQMAGQQDSLLYQDPDFNTVQQQQFAVGNGVTRTWPLTAIYRPGVEIPQYGNVLGVAGAQELVQNSNGAPRIYTARYGAAELLGVSSRQNISLQSNFQATWTTTNATKTTNVTSAPDGTTTAASMNEGTATGVHEIQQSVTITGGNSYTFSVFLKFSTRQFVALAIDNGAGVDVVTATYDLVNGTVSAPIMQGSAYASNADVTITPFGNGWYRCSLTARLQVADTTARMTVGGAPTASAAFFPSYTGTSEVFFCWGAQMETGTQPTALISTTGTAATETADYALDGVNNVTLTTAPAINVPLLWSGSFYYRVRFDADSYDFDEMLNQWWELKQISLLQVKL